MSKSELCSLTWTEARNKFKENPVILIPMGSIEEHGPTTPVGDYRYMTEICRTVAEKTGALSCPTIPWGYSETFKPFPGTISIRPDTLAMILEDHIESLVRFDLDHIIFVCGHKGNLPILEQVGRKVKEKYDLRVATIEPLSWFSEDWKREVYGKDDAWLGHGADPMLSIAMHLFPDDVRMDLIEPGTFPEWNGKKVMGTNLTTKESNWHMYFDYNELTPNGVNGDPYIASESVGRQAVDRLIDISCAIVKEFSDMDTHIQTKHNI